MDHELEKLEKELKPALDRYLSPSPTVQDTKQLIANLQNEFDEIVKMKQKPSILKQFFNQWRTYPITFWVISVVVFTLITLMASSGFVLMRFNSFSFLLPLFLLSSILYSYKSWNNEMRMVEMVTPFPPALLLYLRMLIILVMVMILGLISTMFLSYQLLNVTGLSFLMTWLAPTLFLAGLLAYVSFLKGIKIGFAVSIAGWLLLNIILNENYIVYKVMPQIELCMLIVGIVFLVLSYRKSVSTLDFFKGRSI